jgi:hypothetical protein
MYLTGGNYNFTGKLQLGIHNHGMMNRVPTHDHTGGNYNLQENYNMYAKTLEGLDSTSNNSAGNMVLQLLVCESCGAIISDDGDRCSNQIRHQMFFCGTKLFNW